MSNGLTVLLCDWHAAIHCLDAVGIRSGCKWIFVARWAIRIRTVAAVASVLLSAACLVTAVRLLGFGWLVIFQGHVVSSAVRSEAHVSAYARCGATIEDDFWGIRLSRDLAEEGSPSQSRNQGLCEHDACKEVWKGSEEVTLETRKTERCMAEW